MLTAENHEKNFAYAKKLAAKAAGAASEFNLTYDQRRVYTRALAEIIAKFPQSFDRARVDAAYLELSSGQHPPLSSSTVGGLVTEFADGVLDNASITLPNVGSKVLYGLLFLGALGVLAYILPSGIARARR